MTESLEELGTAFATWRKNKRSVREAVPEALWWQTLRTVEIHGALAVSRVTKIHRSRIEEQAERVKAAKELPCEAEGNSGGRKDSVDSMSGSAAVKSKSRIVPSFSRISLSAPPVSGGPVAEVETADGFKLRIFVQSPEMLDLLSFLCSAGGRQ